MYFYKKIGKKMEVTVKLNAMKFYAYHGISLQEAKVGNYFMVNISYICPSEKACVSDDLNDTINYAAIYNVVKTEMECPSKLLEHITKRILTALKSAFPQLTRLIVSVSKMNPPLGGEVQSASVTIEETW
jgi:dihydroneopterin aldolase